MQMASSVQPAKKSYWFDKGYQDLRDTISRAWLLNRASASDIQLRIQLLSDGDGSTIKKLFFYMAIVAVYFFGSIITAITAVIHITVVILLMICVYAGFTAVWTADRIYLMKNKIFTACPADKEKSLIPAYKCSLCDVVHTELVPGVYGILRRICAGDGVVQCGNKLPTNFMNGRSQLSAVCQHCGTSLSDKETRPICIPVVGGRSVGKTAFITAFSYDFIVKVAPSRGLEIEDYNAEKKLMYQEIQRAYQTSEFNLTLATNTIGTISGISSVPFSFFVKNANLTPDRLIHIYDIAGEFFTDKEEKEVQKQYEYCHGMILIVDPLAIPSIYDKYEAQLKDIDRDRRGDADITSIVDVFMNKLREVTGLSDRKMHKIPFAVVLTKVDAIKEIESLLSVESAERLYQTDTEKFKNIMDAHDYQCRQFFVDNDMRHFVTTINLRFKNNRYFSCSPIGHEAQNGPFEPKGVMLVMEWILNNADKRLGEIVSDSRFTKKPVGLSEVR